jgi:hypothetical protein
MLASTRTDKTANKRLDILLPPLEAFRWIGVTLKGVGHDWLTKRYGVGITSFGKGF